MSHKPGKAAALDQALRGMFRTLAQRPVPSRLISVVDQLDQPPGAADDELLKKIG